MWSLSLSKRRQHYGILRRDVVSSGRWIPTFQKHLLLKLQVPLNSFYPYTKLQRVMYQATVVICSNILCLYLVLPVLLGNIHYDQEKFTTLDLSLFWGFTNITFREPAPFQSSRVKYGSSQMAFLGKVSFDYRTNRPKSAGTLPSLQHMRASSEFCMEKFNVVISVAN